MRKFYYQEKQRWDARLEGVSPALQQAQEGLRSLDVLARREAVQTLAALGGPAASTSLAASLSNPDHGVRRRAALALGQLGRAAAPHVPRLLRCSAKMMERTTERNWRTVCMVNFRMGQGA